MYAIHPRLLAPTEEPLHDLACDGDDYVYQRGLRIAEELQEDTEEHGRRRHAAEGCQSSTFISPIRSRSRGAAISASTSASARHKKQASGAAVARRHDRRRSAKGRLASLITFWSSRAGPVASGGLTSGTPELPSSPLPFETVANMSR